MTAAFVLIVLAVPASSASAAATRAEYVAQAEPICREAKDQLKKLGRQHKKAEAKTGVSSDDSPGTKRGRKALRLLAKFMARANSVEERMVVDLIAIAPAPGDEVQVGTWIRGMQEYTELNDQAVKALRHRKLFRAFNLLFEAYDVLLKAAEWVEGYGFRACPGGEKLTEEGGF